MANVSSPAHRKGKTVEEIYQKKTQLEHILLRPDTYVGSVEHQYQDMWVYDEASRQIVHRKIDFVPALYKIFDEILVNAADNLVRDPKGMDTITVEIDKASNKISVMNNGKGVPVQIHQEHKCYVPELIFGHLLTSDNYNDNEKKVTGGRNGYGAKLTNVFSKKFIVETADQKNGKLYMQTFENNMSKKGKPQVSDFKGKDFTRITFYPDVERFGMKGLDDDIVGLMMKRAYDIAGSTTKHCKVILNNQTIACRTFEDYVGHYTHQGAPVIYERCSDRWEVAVSTTEGGFQQVSFVNSICTVKGGTHVSHVADQIVEHILKVVKGKNRGGIEIKPNHVRNHLWVFVNCLIENPAFDSQTKETLTTKPTKFGSTCELPEKLLKQVMKSGIVEQILDWAKAKQKVDLGRKMKGSGNATRILGVPKLEDANDAGTKNSEDCTLILTEGDSAKALAVAGLSVVGRDKYGVFPLRGKVLNVRDASYKQVTGNAEIANVMKIMGLQVGKEYVHPKQLRYGSIMIMTDQDYDGSHIKGLLINLIQHWWPTLFQLDGFLKEFVTPIVKVWKTNGKELSFFTVPEYENWKAKNAGAKGWKHKYYKGLGTSTAKEAKEYFKDIENHEITFKYTGTHDAEAIDKAFNKKRADDRKTWINGVQADTYVDHTKDTLTYTDFINKELVLYAQYDVLRSIPSVVDGFKPTQRKVMFSAFKKKLKNDIKVAQFVGYISEHSAYHHGEASLETTIINMAQNFVGSNNMNLLFPSGQFGTRILGGKDHAASRYIYTRLSEFTRSIFHPEDDNVLDYLKEESQSIEPKWYCPIIPTVLVNGADGIGMGWSSFIPNYNPRDIIKNMKRVLNNQSMRDMTPWYKGFRGSITPHPSESGRYDVHGVIEKKDATTIEITELPVKTWTSAYKEHLEELMPGEKVKKAEGEAENAQQGLIEDVREYHGENNVHFVVKLTPEKMAEAEKIGLEKVFKLKHSVATTNMVLFDTDGKIAKYESALDILKEFVNLRLHMYDKRKQYLVAKLTREKEILSNKARFILMVVKGELELRKRKKVDLLKDLRDRKFTPWSELEDKAKKAQNERKKDEEEDSDNEEGDEKSGKSEKSEYDYLLSMPLWNLTLEKVEELKKQLELKKQELAEIIKTAIEAMWDKDLDELLKIMDEVEKKEAKDANVETDAKEKRKMKDAAKQAAKPVRKGRGPSKNTGKRAADDDDDDDEDDAPAPKTTRKANANVSEAPQESEMIQNRFEVKKDHSFTKERSYFGRPAKEVNKSTAAAVEQAAQKAEPTKPASGGDLLSRLLRGSGNSNSSSMGFMASSSISHGALGGSEDLFQMPDDMGLSDKPFNALISAPPIGGDLTMEDPGGKAKRKSEEEAPDAATKRARKPGNVSSANVDSSKAEPKGRAKKVK